jgi:hypothetical protein
MINGYSSLMRIKVLLLSVLCLAVTLFWPGWRSELKAQGNYGYDNEKPSLAPEVNKTILWPPNHKMVKIIIDTHAWDNSGNTVLSASVTSNEPEDGLGDGDVAPDWTKPAINQKTGIITLQLRAERSGTGNGRIYTIAVTATDAAGNSNTTFLNIIAPHAITNYKIQSKNASTVGARLKTIGNGIFSR